MAAAGRVEKEGPAAAVSLKAAVVGKRLIVSHMPQPWQQLCRGKSGGSIARNRGSRFRELVVVPSYADGDMPKGKPWRVEKREWWRVVVVVHCIDKSHKAALLILGYCSPK